MSELEIEVRFQLKNNLKKYRSLFLEHHDTVSYPKGHMFNRYGLPVNQLYYLTEGTVLVYTTNLDGFTRLIGTHQKNTVFNLDSLDRRQDAVITTEALTDVQVIPLTIEDIINLTGEAPDLYRDFLIYVGDVLRLMCYDAQEQSINDVKTRLIHFLLLYSRDDDSSEIALSQYRIGCAINASRVQVTRVCSQLKELGLIEITRNKIVLLDKEGLLRYCREK